MIKNITKIKQKGLFLFLFLVSFFMAKTDSHNKYMILFCVESFFDEDRLISLIILFMWKDDLIVHVF